MCFASCPICRAPVAPGNTWVHSRSGEVMGTCFKMNQPQHPGRKCHFILSTGDVHSPLGGRHFEISELATYGQQLYRTVRGFDGKFLSRICGLSLINRDSIAKALPENLAIWKWADTVQVYGRCFITMLPIYRGANVVGQQLRAFPLKRGNAPITQDSVRTIGSSEGLYIPPFEASQPSALVVHEGAWGAIAGMHDSWEYQSDEIFHVAVLSANVNPETITQTLDVIFPSVPRFSLFDQDRAGIKLREKTLKIAKPITICGAGPGKDYHDLFSGLRFERLSEIIRAELKKLDGQS